MQIDDFIRVVAGEGERVVTRSVRPLAVQTLAAASRPGGMSLKDLMSAPAKVEQRSFRFGHVLGPPASPQAIQSCEVRRLLQPLPTGLLALVERINGIHLWANLQTGRYTEREIARIYQAGRMGSVNFMDRFGAAITNPF
jgi:hypothetical protein